MRIPESVKAIDRQTARIFLLETQRDVLLAVCKKVQTVADEYGVGQYDSDVSVVSEQLDFAIREVEGGGIPRPDPERPELLHREAFGLDDLVEIDLTGLGEAVEAYVEQYALGADLDPDSVHYDWRCAVTVEISQKRKEVRPEVAGNGEERIETVTVKQRRQEDEARTGGTGESAKQRI